MFSENKTLGRRPSSEGISKWLYSRICGKGSRVYTQIILHNTFVASKSFSQRLGWQDALGLRVGNEALIGLQAQSKFSQPPRRWARGNSRPPRLEGVFVGPVSGAIGGRLESGISWWWAKLAPAELFGRIATQHLFSEALSQSLDCFWFLVAYHSEKANADSKDSNGPRHHSAFKEHSSGLPSSQRIFIFSLPIQDS